MNPTSQPETPEPQPPKGYRLWTDAEFKLPFPKDTWRFSGLSFWSPVEYSTATPNNFYCVPESTPLPVATRTAPEAVAGERKPSSKHKFNCSQCGQIKPCSCEEEPIEGATPAPPSDKDAEIVTCELCDNRGPESLFIFNDPDGYVCAKCSTKAVLESNNQQWSKVADGAVEEWEERIEQLRAELATARATIADRDKRIAELVAVLGKTAQLFDEMDAVSWAKDSDFNGSNYRSIQKEVLATLAHAAEGKEQA